MTLSSAPSPAWLGVLALVSFAALTAVSFLSGYHLVVAERDGAPAESTVKPR